MFHPRLWISVCAAGVKQPASRWQRLNLHERVRYLRLLVLPSLMLVASGCGGGGSSGSSEGTLAQTQSVGADTGEVVVAITDAEGEFESYAVDVNYIRLRKADGSIVETLPRVTRIDFTELTELTEFLTVATVPTGRYTDVVLGLEFTDAELLVQGPDGELTSAIPIDELGNGLGALELVVRLPEDAPVVIAPGVPAHVTLDFDLDASNSVNFDVTPVEVTVQPFLFVTPELERDREHRVRGLLAAVDEDAARITLKVRPFHQRSDHFGRFAFTVTDATAYEVDGVRLDGAAGLAAVAALADDSPVSALGLVEDRTLTARIVLAGSSVPWADTDLLRGVVVAREDDTLTVRGVHISFRDEFSVERGTFRLLVSDDTVVSTRLLDAELSKDDISIGQRLTAMGEFDGTLVAARVRLHVTGLAGAVLQSDPLIVDLALLGGIRPVALDFSGTGVAATEDADPARYDIDTATLALPSIAVGDLVRIRGLVNTFGQAPPDFNARTVIDPAIDRRSATLWVGWEAGAAEPFSSIEPARIDVDLTAARLALKLHGMDAGGADLERIALVAPDDGKGGYLVIVRNAGEFHAYRDFGALVVEVERQLAAGRLLRRIRAHGRYNANTVELTTPRAGFEFVSP